MTINLDAVSKGLTVLSLAVAVLAALKALPMDAEIKNLKVQADRLDLDVKAAESRLREAESRLREAESTRKLSFDLYQEVKKVLEKKERTAREEEALRVLVESLAEDPFRYKLLSVLAVSATTPEIKQSATESSRFFQEEAQLAARTAPKDPPADKPQPASGNLGSFDVDVFYCAAKRETSEPLARRVLAQKQASESGRWRLRALPESVNQQPGYGVRESEIRYNEPAETGAANLLKQRLASAGIKVGLRESQQQTRWYLSIFVCE